MNHNHHKTWAEMWVSTYSTMNAPGLELVLVLTWDLFLQANLQEV